MLDNRELLVETALRRQKDLNLPYYEKDDPEYNKNLHPMINDLNLPVTYNYVTYVWGKNTKG